MRHEYRRRIGEYLLDHPCVDCGVLDFDHEDPATKLHEVVRLAGFGIAWERVLAEIDKCSVRCANCHRKLSDEMFGYWRGGLEEERRATRRAAAEARLAALLTH